MGEITKIIDEHSKISREIEENKTKAEEFHNQLKEITKDIDYSQFKEKSKEIEELKKKQQEAFNKFVEFKARYSLINNKLKARLEHVSKVKEEKQKRKEDDINKKIEEAEKKVEEKLKTKKKLTTDDLIMLQK